MNQTIFGTTVFAIVFLMCIPILLVPFKGKLLNSEKSVPIQIEQEQQNIEDNTFFLISTDSTDI
ncbi:hypothetical protein [Flammeovirga kamogawensis]|uniref:Uncharacterized protein n=1 Tax=Flammeovirga kamogawensis TaxID=373891 RepID=A0ABX8H1A5_9BACT|nr:hypothetical protein [Flammeovirga kamogawensis]MBB6462641.1 hypothetical protein [Flammeovirga kamogawensis]QWG09615.1 hypothetical protein KM029_23715 [Flammeovirga kamogawensis]TRX65129.1 hypothetical protein EO216_21615 [Flammeovirga kamogawensis]